MAIIIEHISSKRRFILLGSGFAKTAGRVATLTSRVITVCDEEGTVTWLSSKECRVLTVGGKTPAQLLLPTGPYR